MNVYNMITFLMGVPDNVAIIDMAEFIAEKFPNADIAELHSHISRLLFASAYDLR